MHDAVLALLFLILGISAGVAVERLRSARRDARSAHRDDPRVEALQARLHERTRDVQELRARLAHMERQFREQTLSDPLTGVANRMLLTERIEHAITRGRRHNTRVGVLMLSVPQLHALRPRIGDTATDALLQRLAGRLREAVRAEDTVSHLQEGLFAVALEGVFAHDDLERAREAVLRAFAEPFTVDGSAVTLEARVACALHPADGENADTLLRAAEHGLARERTTA